MMYQSKKYDELSHDELLARLSYNQDTGDFTWLHNSNKSKTFNTRYANKVITSKDHNGYVIIQMNGHIYHAHRLAWFYVNKTWPPMMVDHINGIKHDNRWSNLRSASPSENKANEKLRTTNTSGHTGIYKTKSGKYHTSIKMNKQCHYLGIFTTLEEAVAVRAKAEIELFGEFRRETSRVTPEL